MTAPLELDTLLAETRWLSGLARQLVVRAHDAEDLVQETLRIAIERPPARDRPLRGWLRTVLLSRSRDAHRAQRSRAIRECAGPDRNAPSTLDVVVKAEVHRSLVGAVLALEEPYRSCLLLRFFENLPPREIARRMSVPVATVHSRLQRALAMLRQRMAQDLGPRWRAALAPLSAIGFPSLLLGVSLVNALGKASVGAAAIALAVIVWNWPTQPPPSAEPTGLREAPAVAAAHESSAGAPAPMERTAAEPQAVPADTAAPDRRATLRGRVISVHGEGIAGVALAVRGEGSAAPTRVTSNLGGAFELATIPTADTIVSEDVRWATVLAGSAHLQPDKLSTVVVAPRLRLAGRVVDAEGRALPGAAITVHLPAHLGADLGILLDYSITQTWRATCGDDGGFQLPDVPAVAEASLSASLGGYVPRFVAMPPAGTELLEFVLERPDARASIVEGIVVDAWSAAVAGARVSAGGEVSRTDERGAFAIDLSKPEKLDRLVAIAVGMQPAVFVPERDSSGHSKWPARVLLQLGPAPLSMRGHVLDREGHPVSGAKVWIADPLLVGHEADALLAETMLGREDRPFWAFVLTDGAGAFRLDGLLDRAYTVRALVPTTLAAVSLAGVQAGSEGVELRLATATFPELRGRIVARDGSPIAGVSVKLQRPALEIQVPGGTRDEWATGVPVRTDEHGAFRFANVPTEGVEVFALGDTIQFAGRMIEPGIDPTSFVLQVDRRVHLQLELTPPLDRADQARVLDAAGKPMLLRVMRGESAFTNRSAAILDGRSQVLSLGEGAATAVFLRLGEEVARVPLDLVFGQVNTVRW